MELGYYSHTSNTLLSVNGMILTERSGDVTKAGQQLVYKIEEADILSSHIRLTTMKRRHYREKLAGVLK